MNAFRWICSNIDEHGGDAERLTLSGHSAGAHLGAAILADAERSPRVAWALLTSGIFDPRPAMGTAANTELRLAEDIAAATDMERRPPSGVQKSRCRSARSRRRTGWTRRTATTRCCGNAA